MASAIMPSTKWLGFSGDGQGWLTYSFSATTKFSYTCSINQLIRPVFWEKLKIKVNKISSSDSNAKIANLYASKRERVKLPTYSDEPGGKTYNFSEFLSHPSGIAAVLNTRALQSFQSLGANIYRCILPKIQLLNFEAVPLLDLRVTSTPKDCMVEMLSCKFEGSEVVERQNNHFSAFMINHMMWGMENAEPFLEVDVKLNLTLEIYTRPFTMMPISAVERPGNLMMQALVDKLVPLLLQQLLQDYDEWVQKQLENIPQIRIPSQDIQNDEALVDKLVSRLLQQLLEDFDEWVQKQSENIPYLRITSKDIQGSQFIYSIYL